MPRRPSTLREKFEPGHLSRVDVGVKLSGKLAIPTERGSRLNWSNSSAGAAYRTTSAIVARTRSGWSRRSAHYQNVEFLRSVGDSTQDAGIRPSVRRMVIIKSEGRRAPFSPDGPLTWGEIDVVRTDIFNPAAIPGLLPTGPVKKGQTWKASAATIAELTDMEKVESGEIVVEFVGVTEVDRKRLARLKYRGPWRA